MKGNRASYLLIITLTCLCFFMVEETKLANSNIETLTPNSYKKRDFKDNTNFLHEKSQYETRQFIPEEQKIITFKQREKVEEEHSKEILFTGNFGTSNTIKSTAEQLKLFSESGNIRYNIAASTDSTDQNNGVMILLFAILAVAIILLLVFILPKMVQGKVE